MAVAEGSRPRAEWFDVQLAESENPRIPKSLNFAGIYQWLDPRTGKVLYVGEASCIRVRLTDHFRRSGNPRFAFRGRDISPPLIRVCRVPHKRDRLEIEHHLIHLHRPGFNRRTDRITSTKMKL